MSERPAASTPRATGCLTVVVAPLLAGLVAIPALLAYGKLADDPSGVTAGRVAACLLVGLVGFGLLLAWGKRTARTVPRQRERGTRKWPTGLVAAVTRSESASHRHR